MKRRVCFVVSLSLFIIAGFTLLLRLVSPDYCKLDFGYGCFFNRFLLGFAIALIVLAVILFLLSKER